jgi:two-component system chemotaxis response regulator CheY
MIDANAGAKETIIIAEDSPPNRKILAHLLSKLGYEVIACEDGAKAWQELNGNKHENVVAVISDIMMPNMDGIEFLKNVRTTYKNTQLPFVLVTAVSERDYIVEAKKHNVNGYVLKPVTFQRVTAKLGELFPGKVYPKSA